MPDLARRLRRPLFVVVLAVVLTGVAAVGFGQRHPGDTGATADRAARTGAASADVLPVVAATGDLGRTITAMQQRLRALPRDARGWATLGLAYVEQARVTADPTYYPKAQQALERAAALAPRDDLVLAAQAALDAARHDFRSALEHADAALAANAYSARALAIRADALNELGRYDEALRAAQRADELKPGVSTFARLSYAHELRGDVSKALTLMQRAAKAAATPADAAFAYYQAGELERGQGRVRAADNSFGSALLALPGHVPSLAGKARVMAARGDTAGALEAYEDVVRRLPVPEYLVELGELYEASGRPGKAREQYAVVRASNALAEASGVNVDIEAALFEADRGDPAVALAAARAEWRKRRSIAAADAMAWALHSAGRDREALSFTRRATALGTRSAQLHYHRGMVELGAGRRAEALRSLRLALEINPTFSPLHAERARVALAGLSAVRSASR